MHGIEVCQDLYLANEVDAFLPLYFAVVERAEQRIEVLNAHFFQNLVEAYPEHVGFIGLRKQDRLVAGAVVLHNENRLSLLEVGLDYRFAIPAHLYSNLMFAVFDRAGKMGVQHIDLGQTALDAKSRLGARIVPTWLFVKARSPLIRAAFRVGRPHLRQNHMPVRHVFRENEHQKQLRVKENSEDVSVFLGEVCSLSKRGSLNVVETITDPLDRYRADAGNFAKHVNPDLSTLLAIFNLDRIYIRGKGAKLFDTRDREILDFTSGYGALPFGHNPDWVWDVAMALRGRHAPQMVQGALSPEAGQLAYELCRLAPLSLHYVVFANSGAEAVEVAIKAARAATRRPIVIVVEGAFHGKTLGALSATSNRTYQTPFFAPAPGFRRIPYGDIPALNRALSEHEGQVAAFLVEPILGEGGVLVPPHGYLKEAETICHEHNVLLLVDEVQTGLGRTGRLFFCQEESLQPDALILSKALGGGLVPSAACLLSKRAWSEDLALRHSSTFAGNTLAMSIGLAVLDKLTCDGSFQISDICRKGEMLLNRIKEIQLKYSVLKEVRGRGLMIGLALGDLNEVNSPVLRQLGKEKKLVPLLSGYLLYKHGIRVMPTLMSKTTIRLIPPLDVPDIFLERAAVAIEEMFDRLQAGNARELTRYLLNEPLGLPSDPIPSTSSNLSYRVRSADAPHPWRPISTDGTIAGRFAFIVHPLDAESYRKFEPSFCGAPDAEIAEYDRLLRDLVEAVEISHVRLNSATGVTCEGWFIGIPLTTQGLVNVGSKGSMRWIRAAIRLAKDKGADIIGLGGFTSVVTGGGLRLKKEGVSITTGNAYTVATATDAVLLAAQAMNIDVEKATCTVIGANGSVGRTCALLLSKVARKLLLVGNPKKQDAEPRLEALAREIQTLAPRPITMEWTTDARHAVSQSDLLISTTSTVGPILKPEWIKPGAVVCDVASPPDVSFEVGQSRNDVLIINGGVIHLPEPISLGWDFGFPAGYAYACMAETIILAFEGHKDHFSLGSRLSLEQVLSIADRAKRHGFEVAGFRSFGRLVPDAQIEGIQARAAINQDHENFAH
jgi:acetylornithine/succinyldiaminopimelate/putrescine aminotransferase/predicted amino acid dehydrogenase